jgi:hypothetical protein
MDHLEQALPFVAAAFYLTLAFPRLSAKISAQLSSTVRVAATRARTLSVAVAKLVGPVRLRFLILAVATLVLAMTGR